MAWLGDRPWIEDEENPVYAQDDVDAEKEKEEKEGGRRGRRGLRRG